MPIYEFTCRQCGAVFDELLPMSRSDDPGPCPSCGATDCGLNIATFAAPSGARAPEGGCGAPACGFQPGRG